MSANRTRLQPAQAPIRSLRQRLDLKGELLLALLPTLTILVVFGLVDVLSRQRLLFASLASSAFLIYLDPHHGMNSTRTLMVSQFGAALIGLSTYLAFGAGYLAASTSMIATIVLMIVLDVVHPPAVSTCLSFAFRSGSEHDFVLFLLALAIIALLVVLEKATLWILAHTKLAGT